jgi:hypothetical protein
MSLLFYSTSSSSIILISAISAFFISGEKLASSIDCSIGSSIGYWIGASMGASIKNFFSLS